MKLGAAGRLLGTLTVPGDKSIGHRALLLAALADGPSRIRGLPDGADNQATRRCLRALGVTIEEDGDCVVVHGVGLQGLRAPEGPLDAGNSGTTVRLLCGVTAGRGFEVTFEGDPSLSARPMRRIVAPLEQMGARVQTSATGTLPLTVGGEGLVAIDYTSPVASAQVKSCVLLAALRAEGTTRFVEPVLSRDHTERMLLAMGVPLRRDATAVEIDGPVVRLAPVDFVVPGDPSSAAFLLVAALLVPGSEVRVQGVCLNPTRTAFLAALGRMGAHLEVVHRREVGGESVGDVIARHGALRALHIGGDEVPALIDEVPILATAAAFADGESRFDDVGELRHKESDRIEAVVEMLRAFGVDARSEGDSLLVCGGGAQGAPTVQSHGDHRIAMSAAVLGLAGEGVEIRQSECVGVSYPGFFEALAALARK